MARNAGTFGGSSRKKRKPISDQEAQGKAETPLTYDKAVEEREAAQAELPVEQPDKPLTTIEKAAKVGLYVPALGTKLASGLGLIDADNMSVDEIAEMTARTPAGKVTGITALALETYLGGRIAARYLPKFAATKTGQFFSKGGIRASFKGVQGAAYSRVPEKAIANTARKAGLSKGAVGQLRRTLGKMRVNELAKNLYGNKSSLLKFGGARFNTALITGWLAAGELSSSSSFRASSAEKNAIFGQLTKSDALSEIEGSATNNTIAKAGLLAASAMSPAAIPFIIFGYAQTKATDAQIDRARRSVESL